MITRVWGFNLQKFTKTALDAVIIYFKQNNLSEDESKMLVDEAEQLWNQIMQIYDGDEKLNESYRNFLWTSVIATNPDLDDAEVLEQLVPLWSSSRGVQFAVDKPIDEFYMDFELSWLWFLLASCVSENNFDQIRVAKMRAIIRRYSNLPQLWLYLCQLDGDVIETAYTF